MARAQISNVKVTGGNLKKIPYESPICGDKWYIVATLKTIPPVSKVNRFKGQMKVQKTGCYPITLSTTCYHDDKTWLSIACEDEEIRSYRLLTFDAYLQGGKTYQLKLELTCGANRKGFALAQVCGDVESKDYLIIEENNSTCVLLSDDPNEDVVSIEIDPTEATEIPILMENSSVWDFYLKRKEKELQQERFSANQLRLIQQLLVENQRLRNEVQIVNVNMGVLQKQNFTNLGEIRQNRQQISELTEMVKRSLNRNPLSIPPPSPWGNIWTPQPGELQEDVLSYRPRTIPISFDNPSYQPPSPMDSIEEAEYEVGNNEESPTEYEDSIEEEIRAEEETDFESEDDESEDGESNDYNMVPQQPRMASTHDESDNEESNTTVQTETGEETTP